jgi:hypothetical protein
MRKSMRWFPVSVLLAATVLTGGASAQRNPHQVQASANTHETDPAFCAWPVARLTTIIDHRVETTILLHEVRFDSSCDKVVDDIACPASLNREGYFALAGVSTHHF